MIKILLLEEGDFMIGQPPCLDSLKRSRWQEALVCDCVVTHEGVLIKSRHTELGTEASGKLAAACAELVEAYKEIVL